MSNTPPEAPTEPPTDPGQGPRVSRDDVRDLGRLRRSTTDRKVAGVAGGLGRHLDVDPVILRVAFVVLVFFGGAGILAYLACWLLVPEDDGSSPVVPLDERSRTVALAVAGVIATLSLLGDSWGVWGFPWQLAVLGAIALIIMTRRKPHGTPPPGTPYPGAGYPGAAYPGPAYPGAPYPAHPGHPGGHTAPVHGPSTYAGPPPAYVPPPVDPRKRGPLLFWFTAALAVLGLGVLGVVDSAGLDVAGGAYPALVVATCGVMLVLGAFYGRAGGLILVGLLAAFAMAISTVVSQVEGERTTETPLTAAEVLPFYDMHAGELTVDLSRISDPESLAGRTIRVEGGIGHVVVVVPDDLPVRAFAEVGVGSVVLFGQEDGGLGVTEQEPWGPDGEPLDIDVQLGVGEIEVQTESQNELEGAFR